MSAILGVCLNGPKVQKLQSIVYCSRIQSPGLKSTDSRKLLNNVFMDSALKHFVIGILSFDHHTLSEKLR